MDKDNNNSGQTWAFIHICPLFDDNERTTHLKGITVHIFWRKSITSGSQATVKKLIFPFFINACRSFVKQCIRNED